MAELQPLMIMLDGLRVRLVRVWRDKEADAGMTAIETAILVIGLMAVAGLVVAAVTAAVKNRTGKIT
jgi:hypothetical protein